MWHPHLRHEFARPLAGSLCSCAALGVCVPRYPGGAGAHSLLRVHHQWHRVGVSRWGGGAEAEMWLCSHVSSCLSFPAVLMVRAGSEACLAQVCLGYTCLVLRKGSGGSSGGGLGHYQGRGPWFGEHLSVSTHRWVTWGWVGLCKALPGSLLTPRLSPFQAHGRMVVSP